MNNMMTAKEGTVAYIRIYIWMDDFRFYVLYNSISVISGQWVGNNERLCAMEPRLRLIRSQPPAGLITGEQERW